MALIFKDAREVKAVLDRIVAQATTAGLRVEGCIASLERSMESLRDLVLNGDKHNRMLESIMHFGRCVRACQMLEQHRYGGTIALSTVLLADTVAEKHKLYGDSPLRRWGILGLVIRLDSKMARYLTMTSTNNAGVVATDESVCDTLADMLGYCALAIGLLEEPK